MIHLFLVGIVAIIHLYFMYLEMFLWSTPKGLKTFKMSQEKAEHSKTLAANQGLYNGFLAAGLAWGLTHPNPAFGYQIELFFLVCVIVAGIYGGMTVKPKILYFQALPAAVALVTVVLGI